MKEKETVHIATPINGIEAIGKVIRALYALNKVVGYKEVSTMAGLANAYTSQALSSAKSLGLSRQAGGRGKYELTKAGETFARALGFGKEKDSRLVIRTQILNEGAWSEIVSFLTMNKDKPRNPLDLAYHAESRLGKRWSKSMRSHIASAYKSILEYADLIRIDGINIISLIGMDGKSETRVEIQEIDVSKEMTYSALSSDVQEGQRITEVKDYAEFSMPDFFMLRVIRNEEAIDFLSKQLKDTSILIPWLSAIEKTILSQEVETDE